MMQKLTFGDVPQTVTEPTCVFQVMDVSRDGRVRSTQCKEKPLVNGWCLRHQHAQVGLDVGARMGYPGISIPMGVYINEEPFLLLLAPGEANWRAYFERACKPGLTTVMKYLETR